MASRPLQTVCSDGNFNEVRKILDSSPVPSQSELDRALSSATFGGHAEIVGLLLSHGAYINQGAFLGACHSQKLAIFEAFRNHEWDINSTEFGNPALRLIVANEACVKWFLGHGADPNLRGTRDVTPLATAALYPSIAVLELLISYGAELDSRSLYNAISRRGNGGVPVMRFLIEHGVDVNASSRPWTTPLRYAACMRDKKRVQLLPEKGADRTIKDLDGQTPAEVARSRGDTELYEVLSG